MISTAAGWPPYRPASSRPKSVVPVLSGERQERLSELLPHSPREYGQERSLWTLPLLAQVSFQQGLTPECLVLLCQFEWGVDP